MKIKEENKSKGLQGLKQKLLFIYEPQQPRGPNRVEH